MNTKDYKSHPHKDYPFWLYDPEWEGVMYFRTEADRDSAAEDAIAGYLDEGWSEEVENVACGVITHFAQCIDKDMRPDSAPIDQDCDCEDGSHWPSDMAWRGNYTMEPLTPNA